jgi:hypothetical protein
MRTILGDALYESISLYSSGNSRSTIRDQQQNWRRGGAIGDSDSSGSDDDDDSDSSEETYKTNSMAVLDDSSDDSDDSEDGSDDGFTKHRRPKQRSKLKQKQKQRKSKTKKQQKQRRKRKHGVGHHRSQEEFSAGVSDYRLEGKARLDAARAAVSVVSSSPALVLLRVITLKACLCLLRSFLIPVVGVVSF